MAVVVKYSKEKQDSMQRNRDGSRMERSLSSRRHSRRTSDSKGWSPSSFLVFWRNFLRFSPDFSLFFSILREKNREDYVKKNWTGLVWMLGSSLESS